MPLCVVFCLCYIIKVTTFYYTVSLWPHASS